MLFSQAYIAFYRSEQARSYKKALTEWHSGLPSHI